MAPLSGAGVTRHLRADVPPRSNLTTTPCAQLLSSPPSSRWARLLPTPAANTAPMLASLDAAAAHYATVAKQIWTFAELGYMETRARALLQSELENAGFTMNSGIARKPTAFIAEYGSGKPVIAIIGEFDALPGLSQDASRSTRRLRRRCRATGADITCSVPQRRAAIAVKRVDGREQLNGTRASSARRPRKAGRARCTWCAMECSTTWTSSSPGIPATTTRSRASARSRTSGQVPVPRHQCARRRRPRAWPLGARCGGSDGRHDEHVREHIPTGVGIHYMITNGGKAPNVVPDVAEVYYMVRHRT